MADELKRINPPPAPLTLPTAGQLSIASGGEKLTRGERKVMEEYRTQTAVITGQAAKAAYAARQYSGMVRQIHDTAIETLTYIEQTQAASKSNAVQMFCEREKQLYSYQTLEMLTTAGQRLHDEVNRSLYPPRKRGLFD